MIRITGGVGVKQLLTVVLALFLCSCGNTVGRDVSKGLTSVPAGRGVVIFTTSSNDLSPDWRSHTDLRLANGVSRKVYDKVVVQINSNFVDYDFPSSREKVRSLSLPEGSYYFIPTAISTYVCTIDVPIFRFSVKADTVSYLGNFFLNVGNAVRSAEPPPRTFDRAINMLVLGTTMHRDVDFFLKNNPGMSQYSIVANPPERIKSPGQNCSSFSSNFVTGIELSGP